MTFSDDLVEPRASSKRSHTGIILLIACIAQFMVVLDVSIVNVALPSIRTALGFSDTSLQWVLNAYTLTFAGLLLLGGRAADIFGRRRVYMLGLGLFTLASLVGALSTSQDVLIAARALQGIGGAILSPATLTIITTTFTEPKERARALGLWSAVAGGGGAVGALAGGILTDALSWRWIFLINIPIGVVTLIITRFNLTELANRRDDKSLDLPGSVLVTLGVTSLVFGLVRGSAIGWGSSQAIGGFVAAVVLLAGFIFFEQKVAKRPIVPFSMFRRRSLTAANISMLFVGGAVFASWYFLSLYLQGVLGYSAIRAGLAFLPQTIAIIVGSQISSRLVHRIGVRPLIVGAPILSAIGLFMIRGVGPHSGYLLNIFPGSVLITLGVGLTFTPLAIAATSGVAPHEAGLASGLLNTSRQLGGAIGLAGLAAIAVAVTNQHLHTHSESVAHALSTGYGHAFAVSAVIALAASVAGLFIPVRKNTQETPRMETPVLAD